jgi:hypothetical protein
MMMIKISLERKKKIQSEDEEKKKVGRERAAACRLPLFSSLSTSRMRRTNVAHISLSFFRPSPRGPAQG